MRVSRNSGDPRGVPGVPGGPMGVPGEVCGCVWEVWESLEVSGEVRMGASVGIEKR